MDEAICIRVWDWSETSQTVSLFTRSHGVVRALAKGAKRDDHRFSGGFELLTRGGVGLLLKNTESLVTVTSWNLLEIFPLARRSLSAFHASMAMLEIVGEFVRDRDPHPELFDRLGASARLLGGEDAAVLARFVLCALSEAGYRPELQRDVRTGADLDVEDASAESFGFDPRLGGFVSLPAGAGGEVWKVRRQTLRALRTAAEDRALSRDESVRVCRLLGAYARELLGKQLPALDRALEVLVGP